MNFKQALKLHNGDEVITKFSGSGIVKNVQIDTKNKLVLVDVSTPHSWLPNLHHTMIK